MKTFIYETLTVDPYYNLAIEDALCQYVSSETVHGEKMCGMFLWQSDRAVVIGRNQNPVHECNLDILRINQVKLVRRLTGGGAVYQDLGNLNYSIISSEDETSAEDNLEIIINVLKKMGIEAVRSGRNDITTLQNKKISGTAQKKYKHAFLLHGTLLIDLDKSMAEKCLTPNQYKLANKGIRSVKARIMNICEMTGGCSVHDVREHMKKEFLSAHTESDIITPNLQEYQIEEMYQKLSASDWIMGEDFSNLWILEKNWGTVRFVILERMNRVYSVKYETDCIEIDFMDRFFCGLEGMELSRERLLQYLETIKIENLFQEQYFNMAADLIEKIISELQ